MKGLHSRLGTFGAAVLALMALTTCDYSEIGLEFLTMSAEGQSCILLDEGCGKSEALFAVQLDPNCGLEGTGDPVTLSGTFAAQWNILSNTYIPPPIDKKKPVASTQYGYVILEPDPENPQGALLLHRFKCIHFNTKVLGSRTIYYERIFYNLPHMAFPVGAEAADTWRVGDPFNVRRGQSNWGLRADYDAFTMDLPRNASNEYVQDIDGDGHPGVTLTLESQFEALSGDIYTVSESIFDEELKICSEYQIQGTQTNNFTEQVTLGASEDILKRELDIELVPGSTVLFVKIKESTAIPEPAVICEEILLNKEDYFGGQGTAEMVEELDDSEVPAEDDAQ